MCLVRSPNREMVHPTSYSKLHRSNEKHPKPFQIGVCFFLQGKSMASQKYSHNQISIVHCQKAQCAPSPNTQWYRNLEIDFLTFHQRRRCFFHSLIAFFNMHTRESETKIVRILRLLRKCKILTRMMEKWYNHMHGGIIEETTEYAKLGIHTRVTLGPN